jgi:pimeloyl-ACP methyl ester carboxylesterase
MAHFVLVPGAFHGAWCWDLITTGLCEAGSTVDVLDHPGSGSDPTPLQDVTLELATMLVIQALKRAPEPAVLVGHSMGGVIITQVAARVPRLIRRLIYVTAFRPQHGQSLLDLAQLPEGADEGVLPHVSVHGDPPIVHFNQSMAMDVFYNGVGSDVSTVAVGRLCPQPLSLFTTPVSVADAIDVPTSYVVCAQDKAIPQALQIRMANHSPADIEELAAGHSPFLSQPEELALLLIRHTNSSPTKLNLDRRLPSM